MISSQFCVSKSAGTLVVPCESTPSHTLLLSAFDKAAKPLPPIEVFFVYEHGQQPAEIIMQALRKALVPYYPLAGRLVRSEQGELQVACTGDGIWFVEASADCSLKDVDRLEQLPLLIHRDQLLPLPPTDLLPTDMSFITFQVTKFTCGGFVVGLVFQHVMTDGIGIGQFMNAVAEIARGLERPTIDPIWFREFFPQSLPPPSRSSRAVPGRLEFLTVDVPLDHINKLKQHFTERTGERCSTFDVTMAKLWQCRTRAIDPEPGDYDVSSLCFVASTRRLLSHALFQEGGYYGNCIRMAKATAHSRKIADGSISEIAGLIRDAKKRMLAEFTKWAGGGALEEEEEEEETSAYALVVVTDWRQLGFSEVDYGWGGPSYFTPSPLWLDLKISPMCIVIKSPVPKQGIRLLTVCVKKEHMPAFRDGMLSLSTSL